MMRPVTMMTTGHWWVRPVGVALLAACADTTGTLVEGGSAQQTVRGVVDTGQDQCYDNLYEIACPSRGSAFFGQDAQNAGQPASYVDNHDGTVTDLNTALTWTQTADINRDGRIDASDKLTADQAAAYASSLVFAGHDDWRLPTVKELYSLIDFRGVDPGASSSSSDAGERPYMDTGTFGFGYGDTSAGDREIDAQLASSTRYVGTTMGGNVTMFGVNFADGRIKGYPVGPTRLSEQGKGYYVLFVRGDTGYGRNQLVDNGDGTVTDESTGLMWSRDDSGEGMDWQEALAWVQARDAEKYLGHDDWRLPDAKELQGIVDYSRAPDVTGSAAIDPVFSVTAITNEAGQRDYPAFWTSTTHLDMSPVPAGEAVYVCFGRAMGYMNGRWMDVHGAGAQRADPKAGSAGDWPQGRGPQGDAVRIDNFVRLVRDAGT